MNKIIRIAVIIGALLASGCSSLHDEKGWEHKGDPETHQDSQPYILEHQH